MNKLEGRYPFFSGSPGKKDCKFASFRSVVRRGALCALLLLGALAAFAATQPKVDRILVLKKKHEMELLSGSEIVRSYAVAIGGGGLAPKRQEGDRRTPEGIYRIDSRNPASRFHLSLHISYPNEQDRERAEKLGASPGGDIMIHGLGPEFRYLGAKQHLEDWTDGCIAVTDKEIEEIWRLVSNGTPVEIRP